MWPRSQIVAANHYVFALFTLQVLALQFTLGGLGAYFSVYVSKNWFFSGYILYAALIYLFSAYAGTLFKRRLYGIGLLQMMSVVVLVGVMLYPFDSLDHVALLPFLAALQPLILYHDFRATSGDGDIVGAVRASFYILIFLTPICLTLVAFPIVEKLMIYGVAAMVFMRLQSNIRTKSARGRHYIAG
jgi:hypothetical protein